MQKNSTKKKFTWRSWLIKKLLIGATSKQDILSFITKDENEENQDGKIFMKMILDGEKKK